MIIENCIRGEDKVILILSCVGILYGFQYIKIFDNNNNNIFFIVGEIMCYKTIILFSLFYHCLIYLTKEVKLQLSSYNNIICNLSNKEINCINVCRNC